MKLYMFRTVPLSIIRRFSLYKQQCYTRMSYRFAESLRAGSGWKCVPSWSCSLAVSKPVWHISLLCVQWKSPDDGQRNCPKHVEFIPKIIWACKQEHLLLLTGCQQTCITYTIAVCTVKNSWWWTEELSETCRVHSKNNLSLWAGAFAPAYKLSANLYDIYHCCVYSENLLMMDRGIVRNM
jgi:hypothetical protein